jgi:hypothetical protein
MPGPDLLLYAASPHSPCLELLERLAGHADGPPDPHRADRAGPHQLVRLVLAASQDCGDLGAVRRLRGWRQEFVAERMMYLGHQWSRQTVGEVEQGRRSGRGPVAGDAHRCGRPACHALRSRGHEVDMYVTWDDAERWRLSMVEFRDKGEEPR